MTKPLRAAIEIIASCLPKRERVLEIGSRLEKGQRELANLRGLFGENYLGIDMRAGPGVDEVMNAEKLRFKNGSFDLVLCLEVLEHAPKPWLVAAEIGRVLKPNGMAIVSSPQNHPIHLHPADYFRFTPLGLKSLFPKLRSKLVFTISPPFDNEVCLNPKHVILVGSRSRDERLMAKIKKAIQSNKEKINIHKPYRHRLEKIIRLLKRAFDEVLFRQEIEFFN